MSTNGSLVPDAAPALDDPSPSGGGVPYGAPSHARTRRRPARPVDAVAAAAREAAAAGHQVEWAYLTSEEFRTRYVLGAHYLRDCADVVEIGAYRTPITQFLTGTHRSVTVIDPLVTPLERDELNGAPCRVRHVRARYQDLALDLCDYGLLLLGLDLELYELSRRERQRALDAFEPIVRGASRIVLEHAVDWTASRWLANHVRRVSGFTTTVSFRLHLEGPGSQPTPGSWPPLYHRQFMVLDRPRG